jgi:hypothetical protein
MSVRKRTWKTAAGEERQAWLCDYTGQSGMIVVRYADDTIIGFEHQQDAERFLADRRLAGRAGSRTQTRIGASERPVFLI